MNHPPKRKNKNLLSKDEHLVDERSLIDLEDSAALSLEDRLNIYWRDNKSFLISCILVLLLSTIGYQSARIVKNQKEAALKAEYAEAETSGKLADFARTHSDKALGGFAALKIADIAYTYGEYGKALEFYDLAVSVLKEPTLAGRARIGQAFALYSSGGTEEGFARLNAIIADETLAEATRAEAAYHLAVEAHAKGRKDEFNSYAEQIKNLEFAGQWQQRLQYLSID